MLNQRRFWIPAVIIAILVSIVLFWLNSPSEKPSSQSDYGVTSQASFNQLEFYPLQQAVDEKWYKPNGDWLGRLILPTPAEMQAQFTGLDGVWIEIYNAPNKGLIGQKLALTWQDKPELNDYIKLVTTDIRFDEAAKKSVRRGNVNPIRLNGRSQVGPLQSLAGARPKDDVVVKLKDVQSYLNRTGKIFLKIEIPPIMITGRFVGLVEIIGSVSKGSVPETCPGVSPCSSEYFEVVHYNTKTERFDGEKEIIRIPQQPLSSTGRFYSTPYQLESSLVGEKGWYIYGAKDQEGIFTVQALKPRLLFQLSPEQTIMGEYAASYYINTQNWQDTPRRKGKSERSLVEIEDYTQNKIKEGDKSLIIHTFGGIGGQKGESALLGTVTGHFSYGIAEVIRDPFTKELQYNLEYQQIYAHNPAGIISGTHSWQNYMGNLQRGWSYTRPVSDVIVHADVMADYNFKGVVFSPLNELISQLKVMAARYRTGDGTGNASVTPAASCVQDSNQALYIALSLLKQKVEQKPEILDWLQNKPEDAQTLRFYRFASLFGQLEAKLVPKQVVRPDWQQNADTLAGIKQTKKYAFIQEETIGNALLSWHSMLPRESHDLISHIFLENRAKLHFIRTNQIGGWDRTIVPIAPTSLFGEVPIVSVAARRMLMGSLIFPKGQGWLITGGILLVYGIVALIIGFTTGFLRWSGQNINNFALLKGAFIAFFTPALLEELIMRVAWLPHPLEDVPSDLWNTWALLGIIIFMVYHPLNAVTLYSRGYPTFLKPIFLILTGLLGLACTVAYRFTGSLWSITFIHWIAVIVWLFFLGGNERLESQHLPRFTAKKRPFRQKVS